MKCRYCNGLAARKILDLANQPLSNGYLALCDLSKPEKTFPLRVFVCENCFLVQTQDYASADEVFTMTMPIFLPLRRVGYYMLKIILKWWLKGLA